MNSYVRDHKVSVGKTFFPNHNQPPTNKYHYEEEPLERLTARWKVPSEKEKQEREKQKRETKKKAQYVVFFLP